MTNAHALITENACHSKVTPSGRSGIAAIHGVASCRTRLVLSCCSPLLFPDWNSLAGSGFLLAPSPPAPCGTGSVYLRPDLHRYYEFFRRLAQHHFGFP